MSKIILLLAIVLSTYSSFGQSLNFYSLGSGKMKVVGTGFIGSARLYQVRFIKNERIFHITGTSVSGSFNYTSPLGKFKNGESLIVRVINYKGNGRDYTRRATYNDSGRVENDVNF